MELKKRLVAAARKPRTHKESELKKLLLEKIKENKEEHPAWGYKRITA